jgi:hypothetical protein
MSLPEFYPERIPNELAALDQWVTASPDKIPHTPGSGLRASPTNRVDWGTLKAATAAARQRGHRLGFCLTDADPFVLIDLDKCRSAETGDLEPWASDIIDQFPGTYMEISASKTGIHILGLTTRPLPPNGRKRGRIEMYTDRRYVMLTGDTIPGHERLGDITEAALKFHAEVFPPAPPRPPQTPREASPTGTFLEDNELIARAMSARNGGKFSQLWSGDTSAHRGDDSAADLALANLLTFWSGGDPVRIDRLFRQSGLMRPKWDERRGELTYGQRTITRAINDRPDVYTPPGPNHQDACLVTSDDLPNDIAELKLMVISLTRRVAAAEARASQEQERADRSAKLQSATMAAMRAPNLGGEKVVGIATVFDIAQKLGGIDVEPTADTVFPVPLDRIADQSGSKAQTVSNGLAKLERLEIFERQVRYVPESLDEATGEISGGHRATFLKPKVSPMEMLRVIADAPPDPVKGAKNGHGGKRSPSCPDHPSAGSIKRWKLHCRECDRLLDQGQDDIRPDIEAGVNMQDACLVSDDPQTAEHSDAVDTHYSSVLFRKPPTSPASNGHHPATEAGPNRQDGGLVPDAPEPAKERIAHPARPGSIAFEWLSGATSAPPLPDEPDPVDFGDDEHFGEEVFVWAG